MSESLHAGRERRGRATCSAVTPVARLLARLSFVGGVGLISMHPFSLLKYEALGCLLALWCGTAPSLMTMQRRRRRRYASCREEDPTECSRTKADAHGCATCH